MSLHYCSLCLLSKLTDACAKQFGYPFVVKADGLRNGKGVFIVNSRKEALKAMYYCTR